MQFTLLALAALLGVAHGQAGNTQVHVVNVGKDPMTNKTGQKFWPEKIQAKAGDMVQFQYWAGNHTATQSTFDGPCMPMPSGIKSGFQAAAASESRGEIPVFTIMINDTTPKWFYCAQGKHCQSGMVMVINEDPSKNASRTLDNYKQLAAKAQSTNGSTPGGSGGTSGGSAGTTNSPGGANANGASSNSVAVPATMLLVLGSAFMLL